MVVLNFDIKYEYATLVRQMKNNKNVFRKFLELCR